MLATCFHTTVLFGIFLDSEMEVICSSETSVDLYGQHSFISSTWKSDFDVFIISLCCQGYNATEIVPKSGYTVENL
jgi:hypothetical protein